MFSNRGDLERYKRQTPPAYVLVDDLHSYTVE